MRSKYRRGPAPSSKAEDAATLSRLAAFQSKLRSKLDEGVGAGGPAAHYSGQILEDDSAHAEAVRDGSWLGATVKFKHHVDDEHRDGGLVDDGLITILPGAASERKGGGRGGVVR